MKSSAEALAREESRKENREDERESVILQKASHGLGPLPLHGTSPFDVPSSD